MVNWTADKDQTILKGIFKFHDIKSSAPLLEYLSAEIGEGCTPKAVSHRLANIRKGGTTHSNNSTINSRTPTAATTPKSTPPPRAKATPRKKKSVSEGVESDGLSGLVDDDEVLLSPTAARGKRTLKGNRKPKYDESSENEDKDVEVDQEHVMLAKRFKAEPIEDEVPFVDELSEDEV